MCLKEWLIGKKLRSKLHRNINKREIYWIEEGQIKECDWLIDFFNILLMWSINLNKIYYEIK